MQARSKALQVGVRIQGDNKGVEQALHVALAPQPDTAITFANAFIL
jgi:hypothetical protein